MPTRYVELEQKSNEKRRVCPQTFLGDIHQNSV